MARVMGREEQAMAQPETLIDVVCGRAVEPTEAIATRVYKGQMYQFCCVGCAEAFEANPEAYIREQPVRAYRAEERVTLGPEPERVQALEAEAGHYGPEIAEAEQRARIARENVARQQRELDEARARLAQQQQQLQAMKARAEVSPTEGPRLAELEQQVERERMEFEAANRALIEAQRKQHAFLSKERGEIADLGAREKALQAEMQTLTVRIRELETTPGGADLRHDLEQARSRLEQMRRQMKELTDREAQLRAHPGAEVGRTGEGAVVAARATVERRPGAEVRRVEEVVQPGGPTGEVSRASTEIREVEQAERALEADIQAQVARVTDLEQRMAAISAIEGQLADARARLMQHRAELESLGKRSDEIHAALAAEDQQLMDMQRQVERERQELEAARRALADARMRAEEIARRRRAEITELQRGERGARAETEAEARRVESIEAQIRRLDDEARAAEARAAELREAERRTRDELERVRREKREVALEGLPAFKGEVPGELYRVAPGSRGTPS